MEYKKSKDWSFTAQEIWANEWTKWTKLLKESGINLNLPIAKREEFYGGKRDSNNDY